MSEIKELLGIDNNTFWSIVIAVMTCLPSYLINCFFAIKSKREDTKKYWHVDREDSYTCFYARFLIYSYLISFVIYIICLFMRHNRIDNLIIAMVQIIMVVLAIHFAKSWKIVKVGFFGIHKWIANFFIDAPIIILTIGLGFDIWSQNFIFVQQVSIVLICVLDAVGVFLFYSSCTIYKNSYAEIVLDTTERIKNVDIDKMKKKGKWLIIQEESTKSIVSFEKISRIVYYGEEKYVYQEFYSMLKKKSK